MKWSGSKHMGFRKVRDALVKILEWTIILMMLSLILDVLWQVLSRYVMRTPSEWADELAVFLLVWTGLLGGAVAYARRAHLGLDYFVQKLPPSGQRGAALASSVAVALFALLGMMVGGLQIVHLNVLTGQRSAALGMPVLWLYFSVPVSGLFIFIFALEEIADLLRGQAGRGGEQA